MNPPNHTFYHQPKPWLCNHWRPALWLAAAALWATPWAGAQQAQTPHSPPAAAAARLSTTAPAVAQALDEAANLYALSERVYRSSQPQLQNVAQLQRLGIQTIVNLRFFDRDDDAPLAAVHEIRVVNVPLLTWHITPEQLARAVWEVENAQKTGAVLIHCFHGADRTGIVVAMYRTLVQGWPLADARDEMLHGPFGYHGIWQKLGNIAFYLTPQGAQQVREQLALLRQTATPAVPPAPPPP